MRGKELKILADRKALKDGSFLDRLFNACVEQVVDPGPYKVGDGGSLNWDDVLIGDRLYITVVIRVATFGPTLSFPLTCAKCEKKEEYDIDLTALPVKKLSEDDLAAFAAGNQLTTTFPGTGARVMFRLGTGIDEKWILRNADDQEEAVLNMVTRRIDAIEGVDRLKTFMEEAALGDVMQLTKSMNERDCGVETDVEVECIKCGFNNKVQIPLGASFLKPR